MKTGMYELETPEDVASMIAEAGEDYFIALGTIVEQSPDELAATMDQAVEDFYAAISAVSLCQEPMVTAA